MSRQDETTRKAMMVIVAAVALFAAGDSYVHIYDPARQHQQNAVSAALLPLAGVGAVAAASAPCPSPPGTASLYRCVLA